LMKHLTLVFGPPPHMPGVPPGVGVPLGVGMSPSAPPGMVPPPAVTAAASTPPVVSPADWLSGVTATPSPPTPQTAQTQESARASAAPGADVPASTSTEVFHTPAGSPHRGAPSAGADLGAGPSPMPALSAIPGFPIASSSASDVSATTSHPAATLSAAAGLGQAPTFSLTLRRADNVPLGLDIVGEADQAWLLVEDIRLGGAVEAWNRQCQGTAREIRRGDRIIAINGAKDAKAMAEECENKHLLRMTVVRRPAAAAPATRLPPTNGAVAAAAVSASGNGDLRAAAHEFVPQATPYFPSTSC